MRPINRSYTLGSGINSTGLEGEIDPVCAPGSKGLYAPPTEEETVAALRAENEMLRQTLYQRATYADERDYGRWLHFARGVSTSSIAAEVNRLNTNGIITNWHTGKRVKLAPQFTFRLTYAVIERIIGTAACNWKEKPTGLSKLKWLWKNNLLFLFPMVLYAMEALIQEMQTSDAKGTAQVLNNLEKSMSKKATPKPKP